MMRIDPDFLVAWVQAELQAVGEPFAVPLRAEEEEVGEDEAREDHAGAVAERRGWLRALREAAEPLGPEVEIRESRGAGDLLERAEPRLFAGPPPCTAHLRTAPGAALRLRQLAEALLARPGATSAELEGPLGGSPGCSVRGGALIC